MGHEVCVIGLIAAMRHTRTSTGRDMQFLTLEDETGLTEVTLFPDLCPPMPHVQLGPYVARGTVEDYLGAITVKAFSVELLP